MIQLRDGRQIVIPLSLYWYPESELDCSITKGEAAISNYSCAPKGKIVSWADDCDGAVESLSIVIGLEDELWKFDERSMT